MLPVTLPSLVIPVSVKYPLGFAEEIELIELGPLQVQLVGRPSGKSGWGFLRRGGGAVKGVRVGAGADTTTFSLLEST